MIFLNAALLCGCASYIVYMIEIACAIAFFVTYLKSLNNGTQKLGHGEEAQAYKDLHIHDIYSRILNINISYDSILLTKHFPYE